MTPGMLDAVLEVHIGELRRTFGQTAAAAANAFRSANFLSAYDFFPDAAKQKEQSLDKQSKMLRAAKAQEQGKAARVKS